MTVNFDLLPRCTFKNKAKMPDISAVYLVLLNRKKVLYVGQSKRIRKRWDAHHLISALKNKRGISIFWIPIVRKDALLRRERILIAHFRPELNGLKPLHRRWKREKIAIEKSKNFRIVNSKNARLILQSYCSGKTMASVAKEMGWLPSYLSTFLNSRSEAGYGTVVRVQKLVVGNAI